MPAPAQALAAAAALFLLMACSPPAETSQGPAQPVPSETPAEVGEAPPPTLGALGDDDLRTASLGGELGCSFSDPQGQRLLVAMGIVASDEPAYGVIKPAGAVERIQAPGGFDGMINGVTFTGEGKLVVITVTGPAEGGGESPPSPATLTLQPAAGPSVTTAGRWVCGP